MKEINQYCSTCQSLLLLCLSWEKVEFRTNKFLPYHQFMESKQKSLNTNCYKNQLTCKASVSRETSGTHFTRDTWQSRWSIISGWACCTTGTLYKRSNKFSTGMTIRVKIIKQMFHLILDQFICHYITAHYTSPSLLTISLVHFTNL